MNSTKLIATYSRVSTSTQEEEKTIKNQLSTLSDYAQKNDCNIVQEYTDEGWSGDVLARPALDRLREDAKKKMWEAVLIYDPDRLARRYSYQELVMDELREAGIEVIFVTISAPKNSEDKILHGVRGLFAEYERAKITERFRLGKIRKVKEGHVLVSEAPYGYKYIAKRDKVHGYYEINEDEARVVRMIFTWIAEEALTIRKVVMKLYGLGIKPRKSKRGVWNTSTLSHLLKNKAYIGEAHWGSSYSIVPENPKNKEKYKKTKKSSRKSKPESEWTVIAVPPIITSELYIKARLQIEQNFKLCERNKKNQYLLSGKIHCICGRKRTGEGPQHGKYLFYRCGDRVLSYPLPAQCKEKGINARIVDKLVWDKVSALMSSPDLMKKQIERWMTNNKNKTISKTDDIEIVKKEITKLKIQEDRYNKAYGAELFPIEKLREYTIPIKEKIRSLEYQINNSQAETNNINVATPDNSKEIDLFAKKAKQTLNNLSFETKRAIMVNVIEKVVGNKEKLQVYGHIPITSNDEYKTIHRHRRLTKCRQINTF